MDFALNKYTYGPKESSVITQISSIKESQNYLLDQLENLTEDKKTFEKSDLKENERLSENYEDIKSSQENTSMRASDMENCDQRPEQLQRRRKQQKPKHFSVEEERVLKNDASVKDTTLSEHQVSRVTEVPWKKDCYSKDSNSSAMSPENSQHHTDQAEFQVNAHSRSLREDHNESVDHRGSPESQYLPDDTNRLYSEDRYNEVMKNYHDQVQNYTTRRMENAIENRELNADEDSDSYINNETRNRYFDSRYESDDDDNDDDDVYDNVSDDVDDYDDVTDDVRRTEQERIKTPLNRIENEMNQIKNNNLIENKFIMDYMKAHPQILDGSMTKLKEGLNNSKPIISPLDVLVKLATIGSQNAGQVKQNSEKSLKDLEYGKLYENNLSPHSRAEVQKLQDFFINLQRQTLYNMHMMQIITQQLNSAKNPGAENSTSGIPPGTGPAGNPNPLELYRLMAENLQKREAMTSTSLANIVRNTTPKCSSPIKETRLDIREEMKNKGNNLNSEQDENRFGKDENEHENHDSKIQKDFAADLSRSRARSVEGDSFVNGKTPMASLVEQVESAGMRSSDERSAYQGTSSSLRDLAELSLHYRDRSPIRGHNLSGGERPGGGDPSGQTRSGEGQGDQGSFKHRCRLCYKVLGSDSALQIHMRSHTGERPYKCNVCGNRFTTKGNLKVHFQRHQEQYPNIRMNPNPVPEHLDHLMPPLLASSLGSSTPQKFIPFSPPGSSRPLDAPAPPALPFLFPASFPHSVNLSQVGLPHSAAPKISPLAGKFSEKYQEAGKVNEEPSYSTERGQERGQDVDRFMSPTDSSPLRFIPPEKFRDNSSGSPLIKIITHDTQIEKDGRIGVIKSEMMSPESKPRAILPNNLEYRFGASQGLNLSASERFEKFNGLKQDNFPSPLSALSSMSSSLAALGSPTHPLLPQSPVTSVLGKHSMPQQWIPPVQVPLDDDSLEQYMEVCKSDKMDDFIDGSSDGTKSGTGDPNECNICHRILSCRSALQMHYRTHTGERPFRCRLCSRTFTTKGNLKTHMSVHRGKPNGIPLPPKHQNLLKCMICSKDFANPLQLQQHMRSHSLSELNTDVKPMKSSIDLPILGGISAASGIPGMITPGLGHFMPFMAGFPALFPPRPGLFPPGLYSGGNSALFAAALAASGGRKEEKELDLRKPMTSESPSGKRGLLIDEGEGTRSKRQRTESETGKFDEKIQDDDAKSESEGSSRDSASENGDPEISFSYRNPILENSRVDISNRNFSAEKIIESDDKIVNDNDDDDDDDDVDDLDDKQVENEQRNSPYFQNDREKDESSIRYPTEAADKTRPDEDIRPDNMETDKARTNILRDDKTRDNEAEGYTNIDPERNFVNERRTERDRDEFASTYSSPLEALREKVNSISGGANDSISINPFNQLSNGFNLKNQPNHDQSSDKDDDLKSPTSDTLKSPPGVLSGENLYEKRYYDPKRPENYITGGPLKLLEAGFKETTSSPLQDRSGSSHSSGSYGEVNSPYQNNKYMCTLCDKPFSSTSALQIHSRTHTGDRPFACEVCGKAFTTKGNLKVHMSTHSQNKCPSRRGRRMSVEPSVLGNFHQSPSLPSLIPPEIAGKIPMGNVPMKHMPLPQGLLPQSLSMTGYPGMLYGGFGGQGNKMAEEREKGKLNPAEALKSLPMPSMSHAAAAAAMMMMMNQNLAAAAAGGRGFINNPFQNLRYGAQPDDLSRPTSKSDNEKEDDNDDDDKTVPESRTRDSTEMRNFRESSRGGRTGQDGSMEEDHSPRQDDSSPGENSAQGGARWSSFEEQRQQSKLVPHCS